MASVCTGNNSVYVPVHEKVIAAQFQMPSGGGLNPVEAAPQNFSSTRGNFTLEVKYVEAPATYYAFTMQFTSPFSTSAYFPASIVSYRVGTAIDNFGNALAVTWTMGASDFTVTTAAVDGNRMYRIIYYGSEATPPTISKLAAPAGGPVLAGTLTVSTKYARWG